MFWNAIWFEDDDEEGLEWSDLKFVIRGYYGQRLLA